MLCCQSMWARGSRFFERKKSMHFWLPELCGGGSVCVDCCFPVACVLSRQEFVLFILIEYALICVLKPISGSVQF